MYPPFSNARKIRESQGIEAATLHDDNDAVMLPQAVTNKITVRVRQMSCGTGEKICHDPLQ